MTTLTPFELGNESTVAVHHHNEGPRLLTGENGYKYYDYDRGDVTWMLTCSAIVVLMIPGIGYFYNGMARRESSLSLLILCFWNLSTVCIQWYLVGFSLTCTPTTSNYGIIGNFDHVFLRGVYDQPSVANPRIPALLYSVYMMLFAAITPCIILGSGAERAKFLPTVIFIFLWSTFVYDFLAYWAWNPSGWSYRLGGLDFGGGTPVHISTGAAGLAFCIILGKRADYDKHAKPHNMGNVVLGCSFIWFGWLIANAGSGLASNFRAVLVFTVTNMAACCGGITWGLMDYLKTKKFCPLGFCTGAVCGLVSITPASGFVSPTYSIVFGVVGAIICNLALDFKEKMKFDDAFDVFLVHGLGGIVGNILTGVFAQKDIAGSDGLTVIKGGWVDGHWMQVPYQIIDTFAGFFWSFFITLILVYILDKTIGFRSDINDERNGLDIAELGLDMYEWSRQSDKSHKNSTNGNGVQNKSFNDEESAHL